MVELVVSVVLLVFAASLVLLALGLSLLFAAGFVWIFLDNRRLLRTLAGCPCPHCGATLGIRAAKRAFREWDKAPDGVQWTRCDRTSEAESDVDEVDVIIHVQRDSNWRVCCDSCGQTSLYHTADLLVYRSHHPGNEKLHAIADVMSEKDIEGSLAHQRLDAICLASGCDRIDVLQVVNGIRRATQIDVQSS